MTRKKKTFFEVKPIAKLQRGLARDQIVNSVSFTSDWSRVMWNDSVPITDQKWSISYRFAFDIKRKIVTTRFRK